MLNPDLVKIFNDLVLEFGEHGSCDPWWWPVGPGRNAEDWGLVKPSKEVLRSLRGGAKEKMTSVTRRYHGFPGSIAAERGCAWLLSIRPSTGSFQGSVGPLYTAIANRSPSPTELIEIHVTDLIKFRGPADSRQCWSGLDDNMIETSIGCLAAEYARLMPATY
jgi:hypothetical protein